MLNQLSPRLPAKNTALGINTFKHAIFRSDSPGACAGPLKPRFSENDAVGLGVCDSTFELRLETTRAGTESLERLVKKASRGVVRPSTPET